MSSDRDVIDLLHATFLPSIDPDSSWFSNFGLYMDSKTKQLLHRHHLPEMIGEARPDLPMPDRSRVSGPIGGRSLAKLAD